MKCAGPWRTLLAKSWRSVGERSTRFEIIDANLGRSDDTTILGAERNSSMTTATATVQATLWGTRARDFAETLEHFARPVYEVVFEQAEVEVGKRLLDVGCGPGLAAQLAAQRGAQVAGLDAAEASLEIARERTPAGDFRAGGMEDLPWADNSFDVVTGFNSFQYAADVLNALCEGRRVARPAGRVAMAVLARPEESDVAIVAAAVARFLLPPPSAAPGPFALSTPGRIESLLQQAGMEPLTSGEIACHLEFPDLETAVRGNLSTGSAAAAIQQAGVEAVARAISESLAQFRTGDGGYRLHNWVRYVIARVS
jgi:ubiquinone/menaquinone biosynthesis C-methylase UbiE